VDEAIEFYRISISYHKKKVLNHTEKMR